MSQNKICSTCGEWKIVSLSVFIMELVKQPPLEKILNERKISKSNLSADEQQQVKALKKTSAGLFVPKGELLCSTNYVLSFAFKNENISEYGLPTYDLIVIEEASQAFLLQSLHLNLLE